MKLKGIVLLILIVLAFVFNYYYLSIDWLQFTGLVLVTILFFFVVLNFFFKFKDRNKDNKEKYSYAFPDPMAKAMKMMDQRTQYESALLSMFFIMIGMIGFTIYIAAFTPYSWWFKGFFIFNSFWGLVLMISFMVTNYQQYVNYMTITEEMKNAVPFSFNKIKNVKGGYNK